LDQYMKDKVLYKKPYGGLAFWLKPIKNIDLYQLKEKVNFELVSFYTPDRFSYDRVISGIRIGYASLSEANLEKGVRILSKYL
ncbi:MAG: PLP-dependent aminotransferase family protein, partial [Dysgonomonas mossii]|nr:PLP-dependent aminotransferase family protein [Dysgonomonas mossii]